MGVSKNINLWENYRKGLSLNGYPFPDSFEILAEMYYMVFNEAIAGETYLQECEVSNSLLKKMSKYKLLGEFIAEPKPQLKEISLFGLILIDKMAQQWEGLTKDDLFFLHEQLFECYEYASQIVKKQNDARKYAYIRHAETYSIKEYVFTWLNENRHKYKSLDAASEALSSKEVNMSFRTVRKWATEWQKGNTLK